MCVPLKLTHSVLHSEYFVQYNYDDDCCDDDIDCHNRDADSDHDDNNDDDDLMTATIAIMQRTTFYLVDLFLKVLNLITFSLIHKFNCTRAANSKF